MPSNPAPLATLVAVLVLLAGCGAMPRGTSTAEPMAATQTGVDRSTEASGSTETTARSPGNEGTESRSPSGHSSPCDVDPFTAELEMALRSEVPVSVTVVELGARDRVVLNQTYPPSVDRVAFDGSSATFEPATDYRVVIRTNGTVEWNRTVRRNLEYSLWVRPNGTVEVRRQVIVESPTPCPS